MYSTFTHLTHDHDDDRRWTTLHFSGDEQATNDAKDVAYEIERFGPVESPTRTVDWAPSHSLSAPTHYWSAIHFTYTATAGRLLEVRTNAPDELLAKLVLNDGETWAGHAERAGVRREHAMNWPLTPAL